MENNNENKNNMSENERENEHETENQTNDSSQNDNNINQKNKKEIRFVENKKSWSEWLETNSEVIKNSGYIILGSVVILGASYMIYKKYYGDSRRT